MYDKDVMYSAFQDELAKIAMEGMDKESGIQYLAGALGAGKAMGRAALRQARGSGLTQAGGWARTQAVRQIPKAQGAQGFFGTVGRAAKRGWRAGKGRMEQAASREAKGTSFLRGQQAMAKRFFKPGGTREMGRAAALNRRNQAASAQMFAS